MPAKSLENPKRSLGVILYNLDKAKEYARLSGKIIIMEGFFDVIACYIAGIKYAVATMGTAITKEHANLIKKSLDQKEQEVVVPEDRRNGEDGILHFINLMSFFNTLNQL